MLSHLSASGLLTYAAVALAAYCLYEQICFYLYRYVSVSSEQFIGQGSTRQNPRHSSGLWLAI